jgi:KRAB domain-containing zinc finger protein
MSTRLVDSQLTHRCPNCGKLFKFKQQLISHSCSETADHRRPHSCSVCGKLFKLKHHLTSHLHIHSGGKPFRCKLCGRLFRQLAHLAKHVRELHQTERGNAAHICRDCRKSFPSPYKLAYHLSHTHADQKMTPQKHVCPVCDKTFSRSKLKAHVARMHDDGTEALRHSCSLCEKRFASPYYLTRHLRQRHRN